MAFADHASLPVIDRSTVVRIAIGGLAFAFAVLVLWPAPAGVVLQGAIIGGLTALISFGIALVYRANRIVNFAQGDLGAVPAVFAVLLIVGVDLPYFAALALGLAVAVGLGALVEVTVIRRFFRSPRLILTVATLGLSQLLAFGALILPNLGFWDITLTPRSYPDPFNLSFGLHPLIFRGNHIIAMLTIPVAIAGLALFFRYTSVGIAVRAIADSSERAFLVGIPVKRLQMVVWILATVLATVAIFMRAGIVGLPIGQVLGPAILLRALAAAVIGRMENLTTIFFAAVGLGIVEQAIVWDTGRSILVAPILFVVVLGALLLQKADVLGRGDDRGGWSAVNNVRGTPRELAHLPEVRIAYGAGIVAGLGLLLALPHLIPISRLSLVGVILIFAIVGVSLVILMGWAGQVSLGQMAFVGVGAAVAGSVTQRLELDLLVGLLAAGLMGAVVAVLIGIPALRIRGLFLAITTLAFALATADFFLNRSFFGWWLPSGTVQRPDLLGVIDISSEFAFYHVVVVAFVLSILVARSIRQSRTGRLLIAIRENQAGAQAFGVNVTRAKLTAFAISGFLAAFAGGLYVHHQQSLQVTAFEPAQSLALFTMVVVGGLGSVGGAVLGAVFIRGVNWFLPGAFGFLAGGIGLLLVLWVAPGGLGSLLYAVRDHFLRWVARRRRIVVPSLTADVSAFEATVRSMASGLDDGTLASPGVLGPQSSTPPNSSRSDESIITSGQRSGG